MEPLLQGKSEIDQLAKVYIPLSIPDIDIRISRNTNRRNLANIPRPPQLQKPQLSQKQKNVFPPRHISK